MCYRDFASSETPSGPHSAAECWGNCSSHPLLIGDVLKMHVLVEHYGLSWGDIFYYDEQIRLAKMTDKEKEEAAKKAAVEATMNALAVKSYDMQVHAERMAIVSRMGVKKGEVSKKLQKPCKWLYCDEKAPKVNGKAPQTNHICSECWAWEYVDPKTKQKKKPRTCPYLHPGEEGWCQQWATNKKYDPCATAVQQRFSALKK